MAETKEGTDRDLWAWMLTFSYMAALPDEERAKRWKKAGKNIGEHCRIMGLEVRKHIGAIVSDAYEAEEDE